MEELRQEMYKSITKLGLLHPKTIEISQKLDLLILKEIGNMNNELLMMENTALRIELKKAKEENERLKTIISIGEIVKKNRIENQLAEVVVEEYFQGKNLQNSIESIKSDRLKAMVNEFLNPSQEQVEAEIIFKERGIV